MQGIGPRKTIARAAPVHSVEGLDGFKGKGRADVVVIGGRTIGKGEFEPGWRWSENVKPIAGTDSWQAPHLGYVLSGRMGIRMDDGTEDEARETSSPSSRVTMPRSSATRPAFSSTSAASGATQKEG
jgi:hypothetical protein